MVEFDWSPDGHKFAVSTDNDLRIYSEELIEIGHWQGHTDLITSVDWKANGEQIVTSSLDGTVRVWDAVTSNSTYGQTLYVLPHTGEVYNARWTPVVTDNWLITHELTGLERTSESVRTLTEVHIWDIESQTIVSTLPTLPNERNIAYVVWSSDGKYIAYSSLQLSVGKVICVWDVSAGQLLDVFVNSTFGSYANEIDWHPDGSAIAYVDEIYSVNIAEVSAQEGITFKNRFDPTLLAVGYAISWNPDGTEVVVGGNDHHIYIWNPEVDQAWVFDDPHADDVIQVEWLPDSKRIVSLSRDDVIRIWYLGKEDV